MCGTQMALLRYVLPYGLEVHMNVQIVFCINDIETAFYLPVQVQVQQN